MIQLELDQEVAEPDERLDKALIASITKELHAMVDITLEGAVSVRCISEEEMQTLNREYRGKDAVTDVLAFSYLESDVGADPSVSPPQEEDPVLGDVVISVDAAKRQQKHGLRFELAMLLVHGVLHVLGYDHEEEKDAEIMFPLQDELLQRVFV